MDYVEFLNRYQKVAVEEYPNRVLELVPEPLVSCRISTYNHAPYIAQCIESMLMQQTDFQFEIVIGEDESSDGTRDICIAYAKKHPGKIRLFLHSRKNNIAINGRPSGRFQALYSIMNCRGVYHAMCEGDDYWTDPYKLQKQLALMQSHPEATLCVAKTEMIQEGKVLSVLGKAPKRLLGFHHVLIGLYFHPNTFFFKNSVFLELFDKYEYLMSGDTAWRILFADRGNLVHLDEVVSVYRITGTGAWTGIDQETKHRHGIENHKKFLLFFKWRRKLYFLANMVNTLRYRLVWQLKKKKIAGALHSLLYIVALGVLALFLLPIHLLLNLLPKRSKAVHLAQP